MLIGLINLIGIIGIIGIVGIIPIGGTVLFCCGAPVQPPQISVSAARVIMLVSDWSKFEGAVF